MRKSAPVYLLLGTLGWGAAAYGFGSGATGCGSDCASCHPITRDEAAGIVREVAPDLEVTEVRPAPIRGLHQLFIRKGNQEGTVYLDFGKRYLIDGKVIDIGQRRDMTTASLLDRKRLDVRGIPLDDALIMGNPEGAKSLYVFTDPECPFCEQLHRELRTLVEDDPQLKVYITFFPLEIHPDSLWKTDAIVCAAKKSMPQALELLDRSFAGKELQREACGTPYGERARKQATELGIAMTPTLVFPNGRMITGTRTKDELRKLLEENGAPAAGK